MAAVHDFDMPDVGEGLTEAEIVAWRVKPGDLVRLNDVLVEVETAKSLVELPSPYEGIVVKLHHLEGSTVPVGEPIISIDTGPGAFSDPSDVDIADATSSGSVLVGYGTSTSRPSHRRRRLTPDESVTPASGRSHDLRPLAKPPVRKLARQLGIDLAMITPTGSSGEVTRADLQHQADSSPGASPPRMDGTRSSARMQGTRIPIRGIRKTTAQAMVASAFTAPHVTEWVTVDVSRTVRLVDRLRAENTFPGVRVSVLLIILRAFLVAIRRHPEINATWDEQAGEIVQFSDVNLGIAAATPRGLLVPNIKAAQSLTFRDLAQALDELITRARDGRSELVDMRFGTITVTNIGVFAVDGGTPILNPGEAAILCIGRIRQQPWVHKNRVKPRAVTTLAMSFDHRLIDGELGSRVLAEVASILERPDLSIVL